MTPPPAALHAASNLPEVTTATATAGVVLQGTWSHLSTFELALLGVEAVTVLLGLAIAYVAIQGYRRNESRPMLFVAAGFVLLVGVPAVVSLLFLATSVVPQAVVAVVGSLAEVTGMASILYGLRAPRAS